MKNTEFLEKQLVREILKHKLIPDYEPSDDEFLKWLKEIFDFMINAEKSWDEQIRNYLSNARNFTLKLGDNDQAWRDRLLCFCWIIKKIPFNFKAWEIEWCKAHLSRPFFER